MKKIVGYLIVFLVRIIGVLFCFTMNYLPAGFSKNRLLFMCVIMGGLGGITYCLRAVYINVCVKKIGIRIGNSGII